MKLSDIVFNLAYRLPRYTSKFSEVVAYTSISSDNGIVTVETPSAHGLANGGYVTVHNMEVKRNVVSLTQEDGIATVVVDSDHDLTENWQETVKIEGANQAVYNGTHELLEVPNRRTFTFAIDDSAPSPATGPIKFVEYLELGFDGAYPVTVTSPTSFTFEVDNSNFTMAGYNGTISRGQRVIGVPDLDRFMELYEKYPKDKYYCVVAMDDATVSKNRDIINDSLTSLSATQDLRQLLMEPFSIFVVAPVTAEVGALGVIDNMYTEILNAILKTVLGIRFPTYLAEDSYSGAAFAAHGMVAYDRAVYIHQFRFETIKEITINDSFYADSAVYPTRAFRDLTLNNENSYGEIVTVTNINLDDVPL